MAREGQQKHPICISVDRVPHTNEECRVGVGVFACTDTLYFRPRQGESEGQMKRKTMLSVTTAAERMKVPNKQRPLDLQTLINE